MTAASSFIDPNLIAAAIAAQGAGADGRTVLTGSALESVLKQLSGVTQSTPGGVAQQYQDTNSGGTYTDYYNPGSYTDSAGDALYGLLGPQTQGAFSSQADYDAAVAAQAKQMGLDPSQTYLTSQFDNPTGNGSKDQATGYYTLDANGNAVPVGGSNAYSPGNWVDVGRNEAMGLGTVLTAGALGGAFGAGATGTSAGSTGALSSSDLSSLYGNAGYGAADAGVTSSGGAGGLLAGTNAIGSPAEAIGTALGNGSLDGATAAGAAGATGAAGTAGGVGAAGAAASQLIPGITNGQLLTTGAGLLGAAAGSGALGSGLNSATTTQQNTVDPRVAQYVYGANGTSGLLGAVNSTMNSQLATGGLNANQTAGLNQQLATLNDPAYAASLNQMRSTGQGLLSTPQAGNPFTSGQATLGQTASTTLPAGYQPMQTQLNNQKTGLLGNLRPTGA